MAPVLIEFKIKLDIHPDLILFGVKALNILDNSHNNIFSNILPNVPSSKRSVALVAPKEDYDSLLMEALLQWVMWLAITS